MKIKKVIDLCKSQKNFIVIQNEHDEQFIGNGSAIYCAANIPFLSEEMICAMYDIDESSRSKMNFSFSSYNPDGISFDDKIIDETEVQIMNMRIVYCGCCLIPLITNSGIYYIDEKHLSPIGGVDGSELVITKRLGSKNLVYFAIKKGLFLEAVILPYQVRDKKLLENFKLLSRDTHYED